MDTDSTPALSPAHLASLMHHTAAAPSCIVATWAQSGRTRASKASFQQPSSEQVTAMQKVVNQYAAGWFLLADDPEGWVGADDGRVVCFTVV